jgi:hypothetical protein
LSQAKEKPAGGIISGGFNFFNLSERFLPETPGADFLSPGKFRSLGAGENSFSASLSTRFQSTCQNYFAPRAIWLQREQKSPDSEQKLTALSVVFYYGFQMLDGVRSR